MLASSASLPCSSGKTFPINGWNVPACAMSATHLQVGGVLDRKDEADVASMTGVTSLPALIPCHAVEHLPNEPRCRCAEPTRRLVSVRYAVHRDGLRLHFRLSIWWRPHQRQEDADIARGVEHDVDLAGVRPVGRNRCTPNHSGLPDREVPLLSAASCDEDPLDAILVLQQREGGVPDGTERSLHEDRTRLRSILQVRVSHLLQWIVRVVSDRMYSAQDPTRVAWTRLTTASPTVN
jgi:hypothetical protein